MIGSRLYFASGSPVQMFTGVVPVSVHAPPAQEPSVQAPSVQFPSASQQIEVVPSVTVTLFAYSSAITELFAGLPPFALKYAAIFFPTDSAATVPPADWMVA